MKRKITAIDVRQVLREMNESMADLAKEYGFNDTSSEALLARLKAKGPSEKGARVGEDFANAQGIDSDVGRVAISRGAKSFERMSELIEKYDETDPRAVMYCVTYISALWMEALAVGVVLGRRFPLEERQET